MEFKIHFTWSNIEDCFTISGDSFEEIREKADNKIIQMGLNPKDKSLNLWSEQIRWK